MMGVCQDLGTYFRRPMIPFCFGVPLLLPATLLLVVAFLQDDISTTLHVLGFVLVTTSVLSIAWGVGLGFHDVCRSKARNTTMRPTTKGFQRFHNRGKNGTTKRLRHNGYMKNCVSPNMTISVASSANSSRRGSQNSDVSVSGPVIILNETVRIVHNSPSRKTRRLLARQTRTPKTPLPCLEEEDHHVLAADHRSLSPVRSGEGFSLSASLNSQPGSVASSLEKLEKHLVDIGLGQDAARAMSQSPADVEDLRRHLRRQNTDGVLIDTKKVQIVPGSASRNRTLPEDEMRSMMMRGKPVTPRGTGVPGGAREEEQLRRSARGSRQDPNLQQIGILLSGESCERTGVRMDPGHMGS